MRYVCPAAIITVVLSTFTALTAYGQGTQGLSITNYQFVSEQRWSATESYVTYRADLVNTGPARTAVTASVTSLVTSVQVVQGQGNLHFSPVPASAQVTSSNTFTLFVDRSAPFAWDNLQWNFLAPVANAGPGQTVKVGSTVRLDGSGSSNPSGYGGLSYSWTFTSRPVGTGTILFNSDIVNPYFTVDVPGNYVVTLTVSNGGGSDSASVTISTTNSAPVANAGPNQTVAVGAIVTLNGSASSDADGDPLTYAWTMISRPTNSAAVLTRATTVTPGFVADKAGIYIVQLIVNDGKIDSLPSNVTVATQNTPPVANAGPNQIVSVGSLVQLTGSGSTDADGNPLTYRWSWLSIPSGSAAKMNNTSAVNPTFTADVAGTYIAQLIVNDGFVDSAPATVTITTNPMLPPTANAGPNQTVAHRATVKLSGSGTDPQNLPLSYAWSLMTKPTGSNAVLSGTNTSNPTFVADCPGMFVAQLIVNNGYMNSAPSTVSITTTDTAPVANAGANQSVAVGSLVTLDGSGSYDADSDPLTYAWSFSSRPTGSMAILSSTSNVSPTFTADLAGTYVVQLIVNDAYAGSSPSTVTIVAGINTIALAPNPLNLAPGKPGTLTVTLGAPAGAGGQTVNLAISDPSVATIQSSVTIAPGLTGANVIVTGGSGVGTTTILASAAGFSMGMATVNVAVQAIAVALDSATVGITHTANGTITVSAPATAGGVTVTLSADPSDIVTLQPTTVPINAGSTSGSFTVTGDKVGSATISATAAGYNSGMAAVTVGMLGLITLPEGATVGQGQALSFPVKLATGAPMGGVTVTLTSSDTSTLTVSPSTVFIPQANTQPTVQPQVTGVKVGTANIVASAPGFFGDIQPVQVVATLTFSPQILTMGVNSTQNLTLTLSGIAPGGGLTVNVSTSNPTVVSVPSTVTILANTTSVTVPVTAIGLGQAAIHASALPAFPDTAANITVVNFGPIGVPQTTSIPFGQSVPFPVTLPMPAPAGGVTITLSSGDPGKVTVTPSVVTIAVGQTTPTLQPQLSGIGIGNTSITATGIGYSAGTGSVQVTASMSFSPPNLTINGAATQNLTLTLSAPAPAGGVTVNTSSSNSGVATVPATVTFQANSTTVIVPVTGVSPGVAVIHASATNIPDTTANVTVQSAGTISLPSSVSVGLTQSTPLALSLAAAAPAGGITVTLSSSDNSKVTVAPPSVTIQAGQTAPAAQPQVTGVNLGTANISASAPGFGSGSSSVQVTASVAFAPPNLTITGLGTQNLTLTLSAPAPASVAVNLSSSNTSVATVPATATFSANSMTTSVPVTAVATGNAVIHASAIPNIADTTANVTVQPGTGVVNLPSNLTVGLGQSVTLTVTLSTAAPSGGLTVSLNSSDTSKATVSPGTVTIPAGQTTPPVQPQVSGVNLGAVTITGSATGYTAGSSSVQVTGSISFSSPGLTIGVNTTQNLTLTLSGPAPSGGLAINITSSNPAVATVPSTVNFTAGATSVNVPVTGVAGGSAVIHASALPSLADTTANVTVQTGIVLPSNLTLEPGQSVSYPVILAAPAPAGGVYVSIGSSDTAKATLSMSSVYIVEGQTAPNGTPRLTGVSYGIVTITASATGYTNASGQVQVGATLTFTPTSMTMVGTGTENMAVTLSSPAPVGGLVVNLASSNPGVATVPGSVTIPANSSNTTVPVTGIAVGSTTITASTGVPTVPGTTANVTVAPPGTINLPNNLAMGLDKSATFTISLGAPAPAGGVTVTLGSSNTAKVTIAPASVFIAQGNSTPNQQPQVTSTDIGSVTITAAAPGYTTASTTITVNATMVFVPQSATIVGTATQQLMLNLSGAAPWVTGITVNLSSSNPGVATVPTVLTFYPDGSSFSSLVVPITGVAPGTVVIHASVLPYIPDVTANITVLGPGTIILPSGVTIAPAQSAVLPLTLGSPAPSGGVSVALTTSDSAKVTVSPASVNIAAGQTTPAVQPQVTGVNFGTANISASATGYTSASVPVQVTATMTLSPQNLPILGNSTSNLVLTLSAPAPAGGLTINLNSSNTLVASVPASILLGAGATTVNVPVTGISAGSSVITASAAAPNIANATATVTVGAPSSIILPSSVSVGLGQSTAVTVALGSPAPQGGVSITLVSSDTSKLTVSPATISINAGQTTPNAQPQVTGVNIGTANISASASGYTPASAPVQVNATVTFSPLNLTIIAGNSQNVTLTLSTPAPAGGITVNLKSDTPSVATVPFTATFTSGATTVNVPVTAIVPGSAVIHANALPYIPDTTASIIVENPGAIVLPSSATVGLGQSADFAVSLPYAAPSGGVNITLTSTDTSLLTVSPPSVSIGAGQTAPATAPKVTGIGLGTANINASAPGYTSVSAPVQVIATLTFSPKALTIVGTATKDLTLTLSANAPSGGLTIILSSTNQSVATVPSTVTFTADTNTVTVPVTGVAPGSTVIHAGALPNVADETANVNVASPGTIDLPSNVSVGPNLSTAFAVTLGTAAPAGGVTVTLTCSDTGKVTISPPSVTIDGGQTTPATQPQVTGVNFGSANITATAPGYTSASAPVQVTAALFFAAQNVSISGLITQNVTLNLSAPAPAGGVTINLTSSNTSIATVPNTVFLAPTATSVNVPVSAQAIGGPVVIHASALPYLADTTTNVTVQSAGPVSLPANTTVGLGQSATFAVTLPGPAPSGGVTVTLASSDTSKVTISPATITIDAGQTTSASQPQVTGVNVGTANINASASGYTSASAPVQVTATINFTSANMTITGLTSQNLTLNLSGPAPIGGLTINVSSSNTAIATVPTTVKFGAGATTVSVSVSAQSIGGPVTIRASALPDIAETTASVTVQSAGAIGLPASISAGLGQSATFAVTLPVAAPAGGVTVTLTSSDTSKATVTSSASIAAGQTTPSAPPQVTGVNLGTASITASAPGYTAASAPVQVIASISFAPNTLTINGVPTGNLLLTLSGAAPVGGLMVNLSSSDPTVATVPATATFTAGATGVSIPVTAIGAGTAVIHASGPSLADTTATVTVIVPSLGTITLSNTAIGKDLQTSIVLSLSTPAPAGGLPVTLTSNDPSKVVIGTVPPTLIGVSSLSITVPEGAQIVTLVLQGLADNGGTTVTATSPGWSAGASAVTLTPSGFVVAGPNGIGPLSFATNVGISTPLTLYSARLDSTFNYLETQQLRGGATKDPISGAPIGGLFVNVPLTSSSTSVGIISPASVNLTGGDPASASASLTFTAVGVGNTTVTAGTPTGFATPVNTNAITANVGPSGLVPANVTVGRNLETTARVALDGAPSTDVFMTISSNDPTRALLSTTADGTDGLGHYIGGQQLISVKVKAGFSSTPDFYVYGLDSSGTVTYTATLSGFGTANGTITLVPSGIQIAGPFGAGVAFSTTTGATPSTLTLTTGTVDASGNFLGAQAVSGQGAASITVTSSDTTVGSITTSPAMISAGFAVATTQFQPKGNGSSTLSAVPPSGFSTAKNGSVIVTVSTAKISITDGVTVGKNLQYAAAVSLGQAPPPGGVTVTLTSSNPSQLHLAAHSTDAGDASITLTIMPPATSASYYLYGLDSSGTVGYTASAPGYVSQTATNISLKPSAIVLSPDGFSVGSTPLFASANGTTTFYLLPAELDGSGNINVNTFPATLIGGPSVTVPLDSSNKAVGTVPTQASVSGGSNTGTALFQGISGGVTTISITGEPTGFATPNLGMTLSVWAL